MAEEGSEEAPVRKRNWLMVAVLALAVAVPPGCDSGSDMVTPGGVAADVVITITGGMVFTPNPEDVQVGQTVAWHNSDSTTHTATQDGGGFNTGGIAPGATSAPVTMGSAGTLDYHCSIHPSMTASLNVTN